MPSLRQTCLEITIPSIFILWWNRIGSWRNSDIVCGMHLSENLVNDEKTSHQNGFTALRSESRNYDLDPLYFCMSRSGTSSFSRAIHLHLSSLSIFLIQVTFKLSMKTFISIMFKPPSSKDLHSVVRLILSLLPFHINIYLSLPILMQELLWWWQCSDRYIISLFPHHPLHPIPNKPYGFCGS